ncbi:copper homeostasis periplasmic binding protein CopC [Pseudomonas sp. efr-133-TYG-5]|jgi:methionine-rich copper-binding protein CopC|uniref:copper homeostasis periplasmic binding protein CopC n=1 Tax=Pseudomonas sp. efr-133-TYG-5 TaxID=3040310 RepID=UPI00255399E7|nr:copper homeostasis periplasmic binding protein CopC [Pseudomonas sp. efr-133-TYG-5]
MTLKKLLGTSTLLATLFITSQAFAHAHLKSQTPAADSSVAAPSELRLVFSEGVEASFTKVIVTRDGEPVKVKPLTTDGDKKTLIVTPEAPLTAGQYKVEWHAVSVDTHKSEGAYQFKVGQ